MRLTSKILAVCFLALSQAALSGQPSLESGSVLSAAERLKAGEYLWAPDVAPEGPVLLVVSLATQRAVIYRNGVPIGITTVSTGRAGHRTPTGVFTILQRRVEHYSNLYNDAPMPYMQRLTWGGVALHGGHLPGYPASHGCIRLPHDFARLMFGVTRLGMTVVVTDDAAVPRIAPAEALLQSQTVPPAPATGSVWRPEASASGPVSVVISAADRRVIVLRNGVVIGSAPVTIDGQIDRTSAFVMQKDGAAGKTWLRVPLPGQTAAVATELRGRVHVEDSFRQAVEAVLRPGTTVLVTPDSLRAGSAGQSVTVVEG
ncbi:MAG: L,D-transpeptidase [Allosphingosinicella sp.]